MKGIIKQIGKGIPWASVIYRGLCRFKRVLIVLAQFIRFHNFLRDGRFSCRWRERQFCCDDATLTTGFDAHYLYHTAWAARVIAENRPAKHVDISSCLRFVSTISAFIPVDFYDYRPTAINLSGMNSFHADLADLPFEDNSIMSLSCMHVIEHIGLGRYGEPLDSQGDLKAATELQRVLAKGGILLIALPVGRPIIRFNAHRIYSASQVLSMFSELHLQGFALVDDNFNFIPAAELASADRQTFGCGCFYFNRIKG